MIAARCCVRALLCVALVLPCSASGGTAASTLPGLISAMRVATTCPAWTRLPALTVTGSMESDDGKPTGDFDLRLDPSTGRFRLRETDGPYRTIDGFDGTYEWARDESGGSHRYDSAHAIALARSDAWIERRSWCRDDTGTSYASLGPARIDGHDVDLVSVLPSGGVPISLAVDHATHLPVRTTVRQNENSFVTEFSAWRAAGPMIYPFETAFTDPEDGDSQRFVVRHIARESRTEGAVNEAIDGSFSMPRTAFAITITGGGDTARIPFTYDDQKILVDVTLDGHGPYPFVLDTGGHFIVTAQTAASLGRKPVRGRLRIGELRIGNVIVRDHVAKYKRYTYQRLERGPRPPKAGWLGLQLLECFAVTIDPRAHVVTLRRLDRPRPTPPGRRIAMTLDQDAPLVSCRIDGFEGPCMIDTGNASPTIVEGYWAASTTLPQRLRRNGIAHGDAVDARATVALAGFRSPGDVVRLYRQESDGSEATTVEAAILAERFLNRFVLTVDLRAHAAWFAPIPGATEPPYDRAGIVADKQPDGTFLVRGTIANSPGATAGFERGDRILDVDGMPASHFSTYDLIAFDSANPGTICVYRIVRGGHTMRVAFRLRDLL